MLPDFPQPLPIGSLTPSLPPYMAELSKLFADLSEDLQTSLHDLGWQSPTPVQERAIPLVLKGGDLIVQAETGSGKTGAFGIPLVERTDTEENFIQALVMLPTRELANQVARELEVLGRHRQVRVLPVYGGVGYGEQVDALEKGVHIIVGTPGRILDHLGNGRMDLSRLRTLVLDEADEMLSLGFWPDMREVASYLPDDRQSNLFSATIPEKVRSLSRFFLNDPEFVAIDDGLSAPQQIAHYYYVCSAKDKEALLARLIEYEDPETAIIFCNTKADVRFITAFLQKRGFNADQISGDLAQAAREKAIKRIKEGNLRFLVATDVAARGIDISHLSHVISYSTSDAPEVYGHRTGRTGRAGKSGTAISLVSGLDIGNFKHMQNVNKIKVTERKPPTNEEIKEQVSNRIREQLSQKLSELDSAAPASEVDRLIPIVENLASKPDGIRRLAEVCAGFLHDPSKVVPEPTPPEAAESSHSSSSRPGGRGRRRGGKGGGGPKGEGRGKGRPSSGRSRNRR